MIRPPLPRQSPRGHTLWFLALLAGVLCLLSACDPYPRDPHRTLEKIERSGTLWAGYSQHPPWTRTVDGEPRGVEIELVEALADQLDVQVRWLEMSESELIDALERREVQIGVGGLTQRSPWRKHAGFTRSYVRIGAQRHVMAVPAGENRWLMTVERFLEGRAPEIHRHLELSAPSEEVLR